MLNPVVCKVTARLEKVNGAQQVPNKFRPDKPGLLTEILCRPWKFR
jgi:hypothetical protein